MDRIDLTGLWELRAAGAEECVPAEIPGDNYSALIDAGRIPDPYDGTNERECQEFAAEDWIFSRSFQVDPEFLTHRQVYLNIDSLDTFGTVFINGNAAAKSANMFVRLRETVTGFLRPGENRIDIAISSAQAAAQERHEQNAYAVPHTEHPVQSPHRNLVRKTQCHSGWDWGPCLMVSGLYGDVYLQAVENVRIEYLHAAPVLRDGAWYAEGQVELYAYREEETGITVSLPELNVSAEEVIKLRSGVNEFRFELPAGEPEIWWPNGMGDQPLYTLRAKAGGVTEERSIGFRTVDVIAENDETGRSMTFAVNGKEMFCKGANWIPLDALPGGERAERLRTILEDAAAVHMNMIRVWGGGKYESELFYDLCDELGLLVWQDFMFSCACYPADADFLAEVDAEAVHQIKRLRSHPSIALWCGNNECLGALTWFEVSRQNRDRYLVDYDRLYEGVVAKRVQALDPGRKWWSSSPSGGPADYSDCWHDDSKGDMHYWSVWHEGKPFESYYDVVPRFCSEFGFQSFPSMETIRSFTPAGQLNLTSPVLEHHQRHPRGNAIIIETLCRYFRFPEKLEHFVYLSQVQQGLAMKTAIEYWRSKRPRCMGALYWQLNDVWPAVSWSSIEYSGKWKLLHYLAKGMFDPILMSVYTKDGELQVWGVNDMEESVEGWAEFAFYDFQGKRVSSETKAVLLARGSSGCMYSLPLPDVPVEMSLGFFRVKFSGAGLERENSIFLKPPKECFPEVPQISVQGEYTDEGVSISLVSDKPAFYVSLDAGAFQGFFSDNCFTLYPDEEKTVVFVPRQPVEKEALMNTLALHHLRDTYS